MKNLRSIAIAVAATGLVSGAAIAADPVVRTLPLGGTVKPIANLPNVPTEVDGSTNAGLVGGEIRITELAYPDLYPQSAHISVNYDNVSINYRAYVGLYSTGNGLRNPAEATQGFTNRVNYTALVTVPSYRGAPIEFTTGGTESTKSAKSAFAIEPMSGGTISVEIGILENQDARLVEGEYSDTLQLKIGTSL